MKVRETHALHQTGLLAQVGDSGTIVMGEHLVTKDGVGNLGRVDQVHLKQACLKGALFRLVILQRVQEERCRLLDHVLGHEDVDNPVQVHHRTILIVDELSGELGSLVRVDADEVLQQSSVIGSVIDFLGVKDDLVELPSLCKAGHYLVWDVGAQVNRERKVHISHPDEVSELLATFELEVSQRSV